MTAKRIGATIAAGTTAETTGSSQRLPPDNLESLIAPLPVKEFLRSSLGKQFHYFRGESGRFGGLLPWARLNQILEEHRLEPPRLRLVKNGTSVPAGSYLTGGSSSRRSAPPSLRVAEFTRQLQDGATLILDAVDELQNPIRTLARHLERTFQVPIQVNAYAGWRRAQGFDCHWDDHDVFILQVAGRKHWKVYGVTRPFPLARDTELTLDCPQQPLWDDILQDGDVLYIPRGWWHEARPLEESTLHLTVGIHNVTGADLLSWFVDHLRKHTVVRQDVPRFASPAEQKEWMRQLGEILGREWSAGVLHEYLQYTEAAAESRPPLSLPWSATPAVLPEGDATVNWAVGRSTTWEEKAEEGVITFSCNRKRYTFAAEAAPLLQRLREGSTCSLDQLCASVSETLEPRTVRAFIGELVLEGLVSVSSLNDQTYSE